MSRTIGMRLVVLAGTFTAAVLLFTVVSGSAPADAGATNCDYGSGLVCLYKNSSYATGGKAEYSGYDSNYSGNTFDWCYLNCDLNDAISSIKNRGNYYNTRHYVNASYGGNYFTLSRGNSIDLYGSSTFNDELSSHKWV